MTDPQILLLSGAVISQFAPLLIGSYEPTPYLLMRLLSWFSCFGSGFCPLCNSYVFQRDAHARDIGIDGLPNTGKGVFRNDNITDLNGETTIAPYTSSSDCLSLLDRRFVITDPKLDLLTMRGDGFGMTLTSDPNAPKLQIGDPSTPNRQVVPYTGFEEFDRSSSQFMTLGSAVRPLLTDQIDIALNVRDRFRELRYSWILYRTHRLGGILQDIRRFDRDLPERMLERLRFLQRKEKV